MSFINKKTETSVIRAKLTEKGRELLSEGNLQFKYWAIGDSEIDYNFVFNTNEDASNYIILSPKDKMNNLKYPIPQYEGGEIYNAITATNVAPKTVYGNNVVKGLFTKNADGYAVDTTLFKGLGTTTLASLNGSTTLTIAMTSGNIAVGDIITIGIGGTQANQSTTTQLKTTPTVYLSYKVKTKVSATSITVDRALPNVATGTNTCPIFVIEGNDPINNFYSSFSPTYWDYDNLSYQENDNDVANDVKVWNYNVVLTEDLIGLNKTTNDNINEYNGRFFSGFKSFINDSGIYNDKKILGIVHYTNNNTNNIYGEFFKPNSFKLHLPTVLWHKNNQVSGSGSVMGLTLVGRDINNEKYDELVDGFGNVVGKVFRNLHIAVIEDEELATAMSYKSNRNWTLPTINASNSPTSNTPLLTEGKELIVTYMFGGVATTLKSSLFCMNYRTLTPTNNVDARIDFPKDQLPFMKASINNGGFVCDKLYILAQIVDKGQRPNPTNWKKIDVTSNFGGGATLTATTVENTSYVITKTIYDNASIFNITTDLSGYNGTGNLNIGDENILFGTVEAIPCAKLFKTSFVLPLMFNQFRVSNNWTYEKDGSKPIYISEAGIYNDSFELVVVGKLNKPIKKDNSDVILLQLEIDF